MNTTQRDGRTVAVLGASRHRSKFGNKSVRAHRAAGFIVYPVNPHADTIENEPCLASLNEIPAQHIDRVTIYLPPAQTLDLIDDIEQRNPGEVWLNPGSESSELVQRLEQSGLKVICGCSIVDLGLSPSQFS